MTIIGAIREMLAKGLTIDQALTAAELLEASIPRGDAQAERRREKDRLRKADARLRISADVRRQESLSPDAAATQLAPKPSKAPKSRGTRLPADWWPDDDLKEFARQHLPDGRTCQEVTARFKDWAASSRTAVKLDWAATYRNFVRNNAPKSGTLFSDQNRPGVAGRMPSPQPQRMTLAEAARQVMEMIPDDE